MTTAIVFLAGLLIGSAAGTVIMALCVAAGMEAKRSYTEEENENND